MEDYRALSARERKRVRNRISARTFRAKRKGGLLNLSSHVTRQADGHRLEHLSTLEHDLSEKEQQIRVANEENARLRRELIERESIAAVPFMCQKSDSQLSKEEIIKNRNRIWSPIIARRHVQFYILRNSASCFNNDQCAHVDGSRHVPYCVYYFITNRQCNKGAADLLDDTCNNCHIHLRYHLVTLVVRFSLALRVLGIFRWATMCLMPIDHIACIVIAACCISSKT